MDFCTSKNSAFHLERLDLMDMMAQLSTAESEEKCAGFADLSQKKGLRWNS